MDVAIIFTVLNYIYKNEENYLSTVIYIKHFQVNLNFY